MNRPPVPEAAPIKESTKKGYLKAVRAAHRYSQAKRTTDWEEPPIIKMVEVVQDLIQREDLTRETKLVARSALVWFIKSGQVGQDRDSIDAVEMLNGLQIPRGQKPKTSRPKAISEQDLGLLLDELYTRAESSVWAFRSTVWINAGLACGARPIEWLDAEWSDPEQTILRIKNAKIKLLALAFARMKHLTEDDPEVEHPKFWETNDKDPCREIPLQRESDRSMVETQLQYIREAAPGSMSKEGRRVEFEKYHAACALMVRRACRKLWGNKRTYSLYTLRSQFAANMQASKGADGAAELMGHSSADSPSAAYYGKWNQAHNRF
jgi:integrase